MFADGKHRGRREHLPFVMSEVQAHTVRVLGPQHGPHALEVGQRTRDEPVPLGGLDIQLMERDQILVTTLDHLDAGLLRLLDVAAPLLVEVASDLLQ